MTYGNAFQVNSYQAVLATDGSSAYALFLYQDIQWNSNRQVTIGFNFGDFIRGFNLVSPEMTNNQFVLLDIENASNVNIPGAFYFRVDMDNVTQPSGKTISDEFLIY